MKPDTLTIGEQAARWLCELEEGDAQTQAAFLEWLRLSPVHVEEFLFATTAWKQLRQPGALKPMDIDAIVAEARGGSNVVELQWEPAGIGRATTGKSRRFQIAAAAAGVAVAAGLTWWSFNSGSTYTTTTGEQRIVRLEDGSVMYLNTRSRARVDFSSTERSIRLLDGEALFVVAKESARPFRVMSDSTAIQAVGTQFNVRRRENGVHVSVLEGRVKVEDRSPPQLLDAGEEASVASASGHIVRRKTTDIAQAVAWRERRLVFRAAPLEEVVEEINRYSTRRFSIEGQTARGTQLTATFDADNPESLAAFLDRFSHLTVERRGDAFVIH